MIEITTIEYDGLQYTDQTIKSKSHRAISMFRSFKKSILQPV